MRITFQYGLNENEQPDIGEAYRGSKNFELSKNSFSFSPRAPFDSIGTATNAQELRGFLQLVKRTGAQSTLVQAGDTVYEWDGAVSFTNRGTVNASSKLRYAYWSLDDFLIVPDIQKLTVLKKWDGTTFSSLTTGLGSALYAKYAIIHQGRCWLFNITEGVTNLPQVILASEFENVESYDTATRGGDSAFVTGDEPFYLVVPDVRPINGVAVFQDQLIISTEEGRLYKLTGNDATNYAFEEFYTGSAAIGSESMANVGNDAVYMRAGGNIESIIATQNFGDVTADDLSRWIKTTVMNLSDSITIYDQANQKILFFVSGKVLVLFKDILPSGFSPWSVYTTDHESGFNTNAAAYIRRPGTEEFTVYFGGVAGQIYDLYGDGNGDGASEDITSTRKTRYIDKELAQMDFKRQILTGRVQYRRLFEVPLDLTFDWGEDYHSPTCSITLKGTPDGDTGNYFGGPVYFGGAFYYNQGFTFANRISSRGFSPTGKSPGFFLTAEVQASKRFQIDEIRIPDEVPT
jgi:hypothetical protein